MQNFSAIRQAVRRPFHKNSWGVHQPPPPMRARVKSAQQSSVLSSPIFISNPQRPISSRPSVRRPPGMFRAPSLPWELIAAADYEDAPQLLCALTGYLLQPGHAPGRRTFLPGPLSRPYPASHSNVIVLNGPKVF